MLIVQAPGGYGKSLLLAGWSRALLEAGVPVVWPVLGEEAADARRFVTILSEAVLRVLPADGASVAAGSDADGLRVAARRLSGMLRAAARPMVIVLDDYDQVSSDDVDMILSELLCAASPGVLCVLVSRTQLKVPLGALWFDATVAELGQRELRFSDDEIAELFEHRLSPEDLARISVWTEGWPVAVQLVRHSLGGRRGSAGELDRLLGQAHGDVGRYLTEQVLRNLPEQHRELLILTSFLKEFCVELIEAVTGIDDAWVILQELQDSNVLVAPTDAREGGPKDWYRCHQLLRAVMFEQLCRRGRRNLAALQLAASRWFAGNEQLQEALQHAAAAGDIDFAARLVLEAGGIFFCIRFGAPALRALMNTLPADVVADHPRLGLAQVSLLVKEGRIDVGSELLRSLRPRCEAACALPLADPLLGRDLAMAELTVSAYTGAPADARAIETLEQALLDAPSDSFWLHGILHNILCNARLSASDLPGALAAADTAQYYYALARSSNGAGHIHMHVGMIALAMANPAGALVQFRNSRDAFEGGQCGDEAGCALADVLAAEALYEQGRLAEARALCASALAAVETGEHHVDALTSGYSTLIALMVDQDGPRAAMRVIARGLAFARRHRFVEIEQYLSVRRLELQLELEDFSGLPSAMGASFDALVRHHGRPSSWPTQDRRDLLHAKLALQSGRCDDAIAALDEQQQRLGREGRIRGQVHALVLLAVACETQGGRAQALEHLRSAVLLSVPGELVMPFVEQARLATPLLAQLVAASGRQALDAAECAFVRRILRLGASPGVPVASIFSFREREIVRLLADGGSNKMIARALDISPETVRFHLKNVYEKLGVSDRRVVAVMARERGLLD